MLSIPQRTLLKDLLRLFDRNRSLLEGDRDDAAVPGPGARASGGGGGGASGSGSHSHSVSFALPPMAATSAAAPSSAPTAAAATRRSSIIPRFGGVSRKCLLMDSSQLHFLSRDLI